jgi:hypothetical protein
VTRSESRSQNRKPRERRLRWPIGLNAVERATLTARAAAHGVSRPAYVRALIMGHRPGAEPGTAVAAADAWWDSRSPSRRVSIHRNHAAGATVGPDEDGDQPTIFEETP